MTLLPSGTTGQQRQENSFPSSSPYHSYPSSTAYPATFSKNESSYPVARDPVDYETEPAPQSSSNTYHMTETGNSNWQLPSGWKIAHRQSDGRMYYFELASGKTSWNHPYARDSDTVGPHARYQETPATAGRRPDSHQCCAVFSCLVFPPLGIFALVHSVMTYRAWSRGKYGDAFDHSRQAYNFAWWAVAIFLGFVAYHFFVDGPGWNGFNLFD